MPVRKEERAVRFSARINWTSLKMRALSSAFSSGGNGSMSHKITLLLAFSSEVVTPSHSDVLETEETVVGWRMGETEWETRYQSSDMPWEKGAPSPGLVDFL